jgi:probable HAF family extracellular repeat protein
MMDLGTLGGLSSVGASVNNSGQVTGESTTAAGDNHAFLYSNGTMQDLNDLIDPTLGITLLRAQDINEKGEILAAGVH